MVSVGREKYSEGHHFIFTLSVLLNTQMSEKLFKNVYFIFFKHTIVSDHIRGFSRQSN